MFHDTIHDNHVHVYVSSFTIIPPTSTSTSNDRIRKYNNNKLYAIKNAQETSTTSTAAKEVEEEAILSDYDTKVLQSLLNDNKDLTTNQNMERLIERSNENKKRQTTTSQTQTQTNTQSNSKYSSDVFKKLNNSNENDNELWNILKVKGSKILESAFIYIGNKVVNDVKIVGAVGLFALERAFNDATKVLPAVSSFVDQQDNQIVKTLFLPLKRTNYTVANGKGSSIVLMNDNDQSKKTKTVKEELITSEDEIKAVWSSIIDILSNANTQTQDDNNTQKKNIFLKSVLSSKDRTNERFTKSYAKKKTQQQQVIPMAMPNVIDATYELQKELEYEEVGYKTKPVRELLSSTSKSVSNLLSGSKRQSIAPASSNYDNDDTKLLLGESITSYTTTDININEQQQQQISIDKDLYIKEIQTIISNIQLCLSTPGTTWLSPKILTTTTNTNLDEESLRKVVTSFVMFSKYLVEIVKEYNTITLNEDNINEEFNVFLELYPPVIVYDGIRNICTLASDAVCYDSCLYIQDLLLCNDSLLPLFVDSEEEQEMISSFVVSEQEKQQQAVNEVVVVENEDNLVITGKGNDYLNGINNGNTEIKNGNQEQQQKTDIEKNKKPLPYCFTEMMQGDNDQDEDDIIIPSKATSVDVVIEDNNINGKVPLSSSTPIENPKNRKSKENNVVIVDILDVDPIKTTTTSSQNNNNVPHYTTTSTSTETVSTSELVDDDILLNEKSSSTSLFEVELITTTNENEEDDILNKKLKNARTINTKTNINNNNIEEDDDDENEKENILVVISLRALDVTFYIVEKVFITGAPVVLRTSNNMMETIDNVQNNGNGYNGWKILKNLDDGSNRY